VRERVPVGVFSMEMSREELAQRFVCGEARVDSHGFRSGNLIDKDWVKVSMALGRISDAPIYIDDMGGLSALEVRAKARRLKGKHGLGLVVVDYIQLMSDPNGHNRNDEVSNISRQLKALAKELSVPVIAISQLSRSVESRGGEKKPILADLRDSGAIEQDADVVLFVYRPEYYGIREIKEFGSVENMAEIIVAKQRNGPVGNVWLSFMKEWASFENYARE